MDWRQRPKHAELVIFLVSIDRGRTVLSFAQENDDCVSAALELHV